MLRIERAAVDALSKAISADDLVGLVEDTSWLGSTQSATSLQRALEYVEELLALAEALRCARPGRDERCSARWQRPCSVGWSVVPRVDALVDGRGRLPLANPARCCTSSARA